MKKPAFLLLQFAVCAGCLCLIRNASRADDAVPAPAPIQSGANSAPAQSPPATPAPSPSGTLTPFEVPPLPPVKLTYDMGKPAQATFTPPPGVSQIPFNTQNKEIAKRIYAQIKQIEETEFDPEKNIGAITKLQDEVAQTDFAGLHPLEEYIKDSLTLNTLRSRDIKLQRTDSGKNDKENGNKTTTKAGLGFMSITAGADFERDASQKHEDQSSADVSISSNNDPAVLDKARQQQATSYGLLLNDLKRIGFARPVDAERIYGRWKWRCTADSATYEFDFRPDGTVYVRLKADKSAGWADQLFPNKGKGQWKLDYRCLSLQLSDANLAGFWKQHPLIFFTNKEIISIDDEKMLLLSDEDNELKRISDARK